MNDDLIIEMLIHISNQIYNIDKKVNVILKNSQIDFSKEDASVLAETKAVREAIGNIPPRVPPGSETK